MDVKEIMSLNGHIEAELSTAKSIYITVRIINIQLNNVLIVDHCSHSFNFM